MKQQRGFVVFMGPAFLASVSLLGGAAYVNYATKDKAPTTAAAAAPTEARPMTLAMAHDARISSTSSQSQTPPSNEMVAAEDPRPALKTPSRHDTPSPDQGSPAPIRYRNGSHSGTQNSDE